MNSARFTVSLPPLSNVDLLGTAVRAAAFLHEILPLTGLDLTVHVDCKDLACENHACIHLEGSDVPRLLAADSELLEAIEHLTGEALRLPLERRPLISLSAEDFGAARHRWVESLACAAIAQVAHTGEAHEFPAMNQYERHLLHLALQPAGLTAASVGAGGERRVVLYPQRTQQPALPGYVSH